MNKIIKVNIHSLVDVITNSSTVIYSWTHKDSITNLKAIINEILSLGESTMTFDDIFDVKKQYENISEIRDNVVMEREDHPKFNEFFVLHDDAETIYISSNDARDSPKYKKAHYLSKSKFDEIFYNLTEEEQAEIALSTYCYLSEDLILIAKDTKENKSLLRMFESIFAQDATRDG